MNHYIHLLYIIPRLGTGLAKLANIYNNNNPWGFIKFSQMSNNNDDNNIVIIMILIIMKKNI